ncbi:protein SUPPRESSOR OF GENE SILENCING 3-like [Quercus robur]|uniref:protein SUPPRESSOR OF GENE SILENCING 3-like n=1 Tax=Quercus robur TaxID=38942 RepID=UPI002162121B|nr:protein SUPPRESSOR OF GENE SILENCING 3-like [Quercus robur]
MSSGKNAEQLSHGVADMNLNSGQDDDGEWEVYARKPKNRAGSSTAKRPIQNNNNNTNSRGWGNPNPNTVQKQGAWGNGGGAGRGSGNTWPSQTGDSRRPAGRGYVARPQSSSTRGFDNNYKPPQQPVIGPPLQSGWNWHSVAGSVQSKGSEDGQQKDEYSDGEKDDEDLSDEIDDSDDDLLSDEFDSDASEKSHNTRKKSSWFKKFFSILDDLSIEDINDPARQWHCPACQGGPGAIDWYRGLQPLMTHAKTKGSKRVKMHRELAEILEEELRLRGTSVVPAGEAFGRWKGLKDDERDHEIVWPPMVVIMNTKLEQDEKDKWVGMGNQELLDYFSSYDAVKARHAYGPQGHRGMSLLIFEASARGYLEAERLHKHFAGQGTDRNAWERNRVRFSAGGNRQLYGYMAVKEDLDIFNEHTKEKSKLKYEMRSYQEMVVKQIRQMSEDNQQLVYLKNKVVKERRHSKTVEESLEIVSEKLRKTQEEIRIVRQRTNKQHEENKEEMDQQEQFYEDQLKIIRESRDEKEENFERMQQEEREKVKQLNANSSDAKRRAEEIEKFIKCQDKEMEVFVSQRDSLVKIHEEKIAAMKKRHWEEEVELEKEFDAELAQLMSQYSPQPPTNTGNGI